MNRLKKRLDDAKGRWAEELPNILWAYRATPKRSTGETLFSLTYRAEAVIPTKVNLCSARVAGFDLAQNNELMVERLNWLEECQEAATIRLMEYQQKLARCYNQDIRTKGISAGDLVLRKAGRGKYAGYKCREVSPDLRRALQSYCHRKHRNVLFRGPR